MQFNFTGGHTSHVLFSLKTVLPHTIQRAPPPLFRPSYSRTTAFRTQLEHSFQPNVACFHPAFHPCRKHGRPRLNIRQRHSHGHQRTRALSIKPGFNVIVRCRIWEVHSLDMHDPAVRLELQEFTRQAESAAFTIRPLIMDLAAWSRFIDADGHRPTFRTEHPLLD